MGAREDENEMVETKFHSSSTTCVCMPWREANAEVHLVEIEPAIVEPVEVESVVHVATAEEVAGVVESTQVDEMDQVLATLSGVNLGPGVKDVVAALCDMNI